MVTPTTRIDASHRIDGALHASEAVSLYGHLVGEVISDDVFVIEAAAVVEAAGYRSMLIVSDPLHMGRAMSMARTLALEAAPAPTARAGTRTPMGRLYMLAREVAALLRFSLLKTR